jgi:hypothetical protein
MLLASKIAAGFLASYLFLVAFLVWFANYLETRSLRKTRRSA